MDVSEHFKGQGARSYMLNDKVGLPGKNFHLEEPELGVNCIQFVDHRPYIGVFL